MYGRSFEDPDGHTWEPMWMNAAAMADGPPPEMMPS
jgi:predicted lactoylglutathione lyase